MPYEPCAAAWPLAPTCPSWAGTSQPIKDYAVALASLVLWAATGRQFGGCPSTVRPCWARQEPLYQTWPVGFDGEGYWGLRGAVGSVVLIGGGCGCSASCACTPSQITLPGPVQSVTSVQVDGVTLVAGTDYLVQGDYLVRASGSEWPSSQNLALPLGQPDTWAVTYVVGAAVPVALLGAASEYACEVAKAKTGGQCQLPNRVQSVTRTGVEIQYVDTTDYLDKGLTGLANVDAVIKALNPYGLAAPLRVLSPDVPQYR
jgi:hypothetical protein